MRSVSIFWHKVRILTIIFENSTLLPSCPSSLPPSTLLRHVQLFVAPWTVARQALLSMGFPSQEYWSGLLFPSPGDLPNPGIKPGSPAFAGGLFITKLPGKLLNKWIEEWKIVTEAFKIKGEQHLKVKQQHEKDQRLKFYLSKALTSLVWL